MIPQRMENDQINSKSTKHQQQVVNNEQQAHVTTLTLWEIDQVLLELCYFWEDLTSSLALKSGAAITLQMMSKNL